MQEIKAILLLDAVSKASIKTNISSLLTKGIVLVNSLLELTEPLLKESSKMIILEGYVTHANCISELKLYKALYHLDYYFLSAKENWLRTLNEIAFCFKCDISLLSYDLLQAAIFQDASATTENAVSSLQEEVDLAEKLLRSSNSLTINEEKLSNSLLAMRDLDSHTQQEIRFLKDRINELELLNAKLGTDNATMLQSYKEIIKNSIELNKNLKQYELIFSNDIYTKINLNNYDTRPFVLYLKEYEEIENLELFLATLFDVFTIQKQLSVKILRLYDSSKARKIRTLPQYYKVLYNRYYAKDVIANDYLCKSGDYMGILDIILSNRAHLDVLVVVDCKDFDDIVVAGSALYLNLCGEEEHLNAFHLNIENTIINGSDRDKLSWNCEGIAEKDADERFLVLSSKPAIKKIYEMERRNNEVV